MRFELRSRTEENSEQITLRSGTHQVPVLHTPENWMLGDTTPILKLLDGRFPSRAMFPIGSNSAAGALVHVLEEFFDEWIARVMVHYRWHYEDSALFASEKMGAGNPEVAARMRDWGPRACRATGTESKVQQQAAEVTRSAGGSLAWPGILRKLNHVNPGYDQ
jgi:glutathione S-transferase